MKEKKGSKKETKKEISVYRDWCKRCQICVAFCPEQVLKVDEEGYPYMADAERCKGCALCEVRCPDFAIIVNEVPITDKKESTSKKTGQKKDEQKKSGKAQ